MKKYEARIYLGKELYQEIEKTVKIGVFKSVNQALAEIVKSGPFIDYLKAVNETLTKGDSN